MDTYRYANGDENKVRNLTEQETNNLLSVARWKPYRIVWGYIDESNELVIKAHTTRQGLNKKRKEGFLIYEVVKG